MSADIHFFATKDDLLPIFELVESLALVQYILFGVFSAPQPDRFFQGTDLPNLGMASCEAACGCDAYLVADRATDVASYKLSPFGGKERFAFDQLNNPHTIVFSPGGIWKNDILLHGRVSTVSESAASVKLMKLFGSAIRKNYKKVRAFYVGREAFGMLKEGKRLTIAEQASRDFDLAAPKE